jgi:hypothetical protein
VKKQIPNISLLAFRRTMIRANDAIKPSGAVVKPGLIGV